MDKLEFDDITLSKFDMNTLIRDSSGEYLNPKIAIIAKSGSGKSWIVKDIMYHMKDMPAYNVIAPTDTKTRFYDSFMNSKMIYHEYDDSILSKLIKRQDYIVEEVYNKQKDNKTKMIDPRVCLIMDDCMSSKKDWIKNHDITKIFYEGRHYKITFILTVQYCMDIPPELRANFDFIFLLAEDIENNRKKLHEHYAGIIPRKSFNNLFMKVTSNYGCLVINNRSRDYDLTKRVFWYKAKNRPPFIVGGDALKKQIIKAKEKMLNEMKNKMIFRTS